MMLNIGAFFFCVFVPLLLPSFGTASASAIKNHPSRVRRSSSFFIPKEMLSSIDLEDTPELKCKNGGSLSDTQACDCKEGFVGNLCEHESRRCEVYKTDNCPTGQWCVADNLNCYLYPCRKPMGWCLPHASN